MKKNLNCKPDFDELTADLADAGYPGFSHLKSSRLKSPMEVLISAFQAERLEARIVEALPWLILEISEEDWDKAARAAIKEDRQNHLGFITSLARQAAEKRGELEKTARLKEREDELAGWRLPKEDGFCPDLTKTEKEWIRQNRSPEAQYWRVLSDLTVEHLSYIA